MPGMKGYEVARRLRESGSSSRVLALSGYDEKDYIYGMLTSGAVGYLTKDDAPRYLLSAVKEIATGSRGWVSPNIAEQLGVQARSEDGSAVPKLTKLEVSILNLLADGKTDVEVGLALGRKHKVVLERIHSIQKKMGVETNLDAVLRAIQEGIL
jgi:DNA-binding NarL/FixJ family response regulator